MIPFCCSLSQSCGCGCKADLTGALTRSLGPALHQQMPVTAAACVPVSSALLQAACLLNASPVQVCKAQEPDWPAELSCRECPPSRQHMQSLPRACPATMPVATL